MEYTIVACVVVLVVLAVFVLGLRAKESEHLGNVTKDDTKDYTKDYTKDVTQDYTKDDTQDYTKDDTKDDTKDYTKPDTKPDKQRYLSFLGNLLDTYDKKWLETPVCNQRMLEKVRNDSLKMAYNVSNAESCKQFAAEVCEFTDPKMYIADNPRAFPRWFSKTLLSMDPPKNTNLNCFATNYNCCLQSL